MRLLSSLVVAAVLGHVVCPSASGETNVAVLPRPASITTNDYYTSNRAPLLPSVLVKLPVGLIEPRGWLLETLNRQRDGLTGHLTEISAWLQKDNNAWLSPDGRGKWGWEEVPYWLRGYISLARQLNDDDMMKKASIWIEAVFAGQRSDGNFGPLRVFGDDDSQDLWANMLMLHCLETYYEYSNDPRVLSLMSKYFKYQSTIPDDKLLTHFWQFYRGGDNLYSVYWLYNHTGETWLLPLAERIHQNTANWRLNDDLPNWHNVNIAQGFNEPAIFYLQSQAPEDLAAAYRNFKLVRSRYGQVPGGMYGADENARVGYHDPRQGIETCGIVEQMRADENLLVITGDTSWADNCEDVAFNSLPAAFMPDYRALRYLTAPNLPQSDADNHAPGVDNSGPQFAMNALSHRCCQHNHSQGWPRFVEHLWMATADNGLCATMYGPCVVRAKVANGVDASIEENTRYPFEETVQLKVGVPKPTAFPLYVRIPNWCTESAIQVAGESVAENVDPSSYVRIFRNWKAGDTVTIHLPMAIKLRRWARNHNSISVDRGPLTYSLRIGEQNVQRDPTQTAQQDSQWRDDLDTSKWPSFEIMPTTPWNYGLELASDTPEQGFKVMYGEWPKDNYPFTADSPPIRLQANGRRITDWGFDLTGLCGMLHDSPVYSSMPREEITLIPMGGARLRISAFPEVRDDRNLPSWRAQVPKAVQYRASASQCNEPDTVNALVDGVEPCASNDRGIPRQTFLPHLGSTEWIQADFGQSRHVDRTSVYWCDDRTKFDDVPTGTFDRLPAGQNCRVPKHWRVLYLSDSEWKEVVPTSPYDTETNKYNTVSFEPVETKGLRIEVQLAPRASAGVLEWKIPASETLAKDR